MSIEMVIWLTTGRCNLNCVHCYASRFRGVEEMSLDEASRFIKDIAEYGVKRVALTGGEPLLRRGIRAIIKDIKEYGMSCNMSTNLTNLDEDLARFLSKHEIYLYISLDGDGAETFERVRGAGSWRLFERGMDLVKRYGISFSTVMALCKKNSSAVKGYVDLAERLGANFACIIPALPVGRAKANEVFPSKDEVIYSIKDFAEKCDELGYGGCIWCYKPAELLIDSQHVYVSGGCRTDRVIDIDPVGKILLCDTLDFRVSDVRDGFERAVREYYSNELVREVMNPSLGDPCNRCRLREVCMGGCYTRSLLLRGSLNSPDPYCPLVSDPPNYP